MSSSIGVVPTRRYATSIALALALCLWGTFASAQVTIQPKAEVFVKVLRENGSHVSLSPGAKNLTRVLVGVRIPRENL